MGGIGLFEESGKFKQLITYVGRERVAYTEGHKYISPTERSILAITNEIGVFPPEDYQGIIIITLFKRKTSPN